MHRANPPPINFIGHAAHVALYGFLVGNSCTTALNSKPVNQAMAPVSGMGRFVLIPLIAAHVTGSLAEHVVFKTDSLVRMLGADRKQQPAGPAFRLSTGPRRSAGHKDRGPAFCGDR
jgi:hypothetical protein